jgi:dTDP-glucose pyrophosphorylase
MGVKKFSDNVIQDTSSIKTAMEALNNLVNKESLTLFIVNSQNQLSGTLTDGDIRRGLLRGLQLTDKVSEVMHRNFRYLEQDFGLEQIDLLKKQGIALIPLVNKNREIIRILLLKDKQSVLPVDAFLLAGGEGKRLLPLTAEVPKPMLKVGGKPIIEHNIDRLRSFGIFNIFLSVNYLAEKIQDYLGNGEEKEVSIKYIEEDLPMGTIGSISLVENFAHDSILVMNSDLLTNIDFEDFYRTFTRSGADMAVAGVPYKVDVPYAIMEVSEEKVTSFREKPTYTYYSNAGIYLLKKNILDLVPKNRHYNATDLMEEVLRKKKHLIYYPILGYWLDIGQHEDYKRAQDDIRHIKL